MILFSIYKFCSILDIPGVLQNFLLPCPFKKLTGIDCPGCGFQRSVISLISGNIKNSLILYPATVPLLITVAFVVLDARWRFDRGNVAKKVLYIFTGLIITASYITKMAGITVPLNF